MQDMTYIIKPQKTFEEFTSCDNTLRGSGLERGVLPRGEASKEKDAQTEIAFKIKGLNSDFRQFKQVA